MAEMEHRDVRFEASDASIRGIVIFGVVLTVVVTVIMVGLQLLMRGYAAPRAAAAPGGAPARVRPSAVPPPPLLEGLETLQAPEEEAAPALTPQKGYEWVDRKAGIVRIPIDKAMTLTTERLKSRPIKPGQETWTEGREQPSSANSGRMPRKK